MATPRTLPLLVIVAEYGERPVITHPNTYYDDLIYKSTKHPSVNAFFIENSQGRFYWSRPGQGVVGKVKMPASVGRDVNDNTRPAKVIAEVMRSGFNFGFFDANNDKKVTPNELAIMIIENYPSGARRGTDPPCIKTSNSSVEVCTQVLLLGDQPSLSLLSHELSHFIEAIDLYGRWNVDDFNSGCTLMGSYRSNMESMHLDPWHKLQFGWIEPKIHSVLSSGHYLLKSANQTNTNPAIILFDPRKGVNEYFIIEYRSPNQRVNNFTYNYDRNVCGDGLAIWHILQKENKEPNTIPHIGGVAGITSYGVFLEGAPNLKRGGNKLFVSGTTTPLLRWLDGSMTGVGIEVEPFTSGANEITINILPNLMNLIDATALGGTLSIPAGRYIVPKSAKITKKITLKAKEGNVTIR